MFDELHVFQVLILINHYIVSSDTDRESRDANGAKPIKDDQDHSNVRAVSKQCQSNALGPSTY